MMEVVVTTGAIGRAKLQSNHHHQQTNIQFFLQAGCPPCRAINSVKALTGMSFIPLLPIIIITRNNNYTTTNKKPT